VGKSPGHYGVGGFIWVHGTNWYTADLRWRCCDEFINYRADLGLLLCFRVEHVAQEETDQTLATKLVERTSIDIA
jgi:hypothetical protein